MSIMTGLNGVAVRHNIALDDFRLGAETVDQKAVAVGVSSPHMPPFADGLLGMDVLSRFDVDFDLPNKRIVLYRWRNCPGGSAPGDTSWVAVPLADETQKTGRPFVTGTLDGGAVLVMVDSGASALNVRHDTALRVGVPAATLDAERQVDINGVGPNAVRGAIHRFRLFAIGELRMRNMPGLVSTPGPTDADVLFGAPMLRATRVWLSTSGGRLYLARRGPAADAAGAPTPNAK
jgi:predicted aspartyl protease